MRKGYTLKSGLIAILIYILMIFIAIFAFMQNNKEEKIQYTKEEAIKVDMSSIEMPSSQKLKKKEEVKVSKKIENIFDEKKKSLKKEFKKIEKSKKIETSKLEEITPKSTPNKTKEKSDKNTTIKKIDTVKKVSKETPMTNKVSPKITKDAVSIFEAIDANVPTHSTKTISITSQKQAASTDTNIATAKISSKASNLVNSLLSAKSSGVEDSYKSKVKSILNGWPAQSDFAGNKAKIKFIIEPSGRFEFDVISRSSNEEFNKGLIQYLKQLQKVGFGAHGGNRAYIFDVDFVAER